MYISDKLFNYQPILILFLEIFSQKKQKKQLKDIFSCFYNIYIKIGGGRGIRTHRKGFKPFTRLAGEHLQPLGQPSVYNINNKGLPTQNQPQNNILVSHTGFEPVISALRGQCPRPLDEWDMLLAEEQGLEPQLNGPEPFVFPLDHSSKNWGE